jgi:hypothetical protein
MQAFPIIQQAGPLPIQQSFSAPLIGPALLMVTGTLWATAANIMVQMNVMLDGTQVGTAQLFSNAASTHRTLPTLLLNLQLGQGSHTLQLTASGSNVTSDYNDLFSAMILY